MAETETYLYHLNMRHMSGRVVKFRVLDVDEVEAIQANAARAVGEDAMMNELIALQRKMLASAFIVAISPPGQEPARKAVAVDDPDKPNQKKVVGAVLGGEPDLEKLQDVAFTKCDASTLQRDWAKVFNTKETTCLYQLYRDWHDISTAEQEMILGKGTPSPTGV